MAEYRDRRLMVDVSSSLGEDRVLWGGCMKRRVPRNTLGRKIDNFWSTYALDHVSEDTARREV